MVGDDLIHYYDELTVSNHELYNSQERYIYIYIYMRKCTNDCQRPHYRTIIIMTFFLILLYVLYLILNKITFYILDDIYRASLSTKNKEDGIYRAFHFSVTTLVI